MTAAAAIRIAVATEADVVLARQKGRTLAGRLGFGGSDPMFIATAISEIARNILVHAGRGEVELSVETQPGKIGLVVVARDGGPGIADVELAMKEGWSSVGSLGLGLPGAKRLMDEFEVATGPGNGTTITMKKWTRSSGRRIDLASVLA